MSESKAFPLLAQPVKLGAIQATNRVLMASLTRNRAVDTIPNEENVKYYAQRAKAGGAGLILTEGTLICHQGTEWPHAAGLWDEEHAEGWRKVVEAVHKEGVPIVVQLWHVGRVAHPNQGEQKKSGRPVYAPSAVAARGGKFRDLPGSPGYVTPTAVPDPQEIIDQFEHAAKMAKLAGFDGVEFHSANGYLGEQFLSDVSNVRTDQYGGSVENRTRFGLAVVDKLIGVYGADRVGIKISPAGGYNDLYFSSTDVLVETFKHYIEKLDERNLAYLQVMQYNAYGDANFDGHPQGYDHDVIATYKSLVKRSNFVVNCGYDGAKGEKEVAERGVAAITYGQAFISNPDYLKRIQEGLPLNELNPKTFYQFNPDNVGDGYTSYPFAQESSASLSIHLTTTSNMSAAAGPSTKPVTVTYCNVCSLPVEYCEFGSSISKCKSWLEEQDPQLFSKLYGEDAIKEKIGTLSLDAQEKLEAEADKAERKAEKKAETEKKKKAAAKVTIKREQRTKRKTLTSIHGLEAFSIDLKKAAKFFANRFATGSSVSKNPQGLDEIVIQGDVWEEVRDLIIEEAGPLKGVPAEQIVKAEDKKKKSEE